MNHFYLTFGQKYAREPHPTFRDAHPDGYVLIEANTEDEARGIALTVFQRQYGGLYEDLPEYRYVPRGCLGVVKHGTSHVSAAGQ